MNRVAMVVLAATLAASVMPRPTRAQQVATVEIVPDHVTVVAGESIHLRAVARDAGGNEVPGAHLEWLATPFDVAGADEEGTVSTFRPGRVYVFALGGAQPGVAVVDITERPQARLEIAAPEGSTTVVGGTLALEARAFTEVGDPVPAGGVTWRSERPDIATVDAAGLVTGRAPGRATIVANAAGAAGLAARTEVSVAANPVAWIAVAPAGPVRTGDVVTLQAETREGSGRAVAAPVRWSVTGEGATIDAAGRFVAERQGSYAVTASAGGVAARGSVRVEPRPAGGRLEAVGHAPLPKDVQGAEVWPQGDVAYVSTVADKLYVFDVSDPASPALVDSLVVDARLINDVSTTADGKIGVLSREGASDRKNGLVFFDASDPRHPKILSTYSEGVSGGVHSAFVYQHYVFATDDATGSLRIIDFQDPTAPREVARWDLPRENVQAYHVEFLEVSPRRYLHDVYVADGIAYLAYWKDGLVILDVGNGIAGGTIEKPAVVGRYVYNLAALYPPDYISGTHAVLRRGNYVFLGDESYSGTLDLASREKFATRGMLHVLDVSDLRSPRLVARWDPVEFGVHNLAAEGDRLYIGAYDGGIRVVDVAGELSGELGREGRVVGSLYTGSLQGYRPNMALTWSAVPRNGLVYASDINSGLWIARWTE